MFYRCRWEAEGGWSWLWMRVWFFAVSSLADAQKDHRADGASVRPEQGRGSARGMGLRGCPSPNVHGLLCVSLFGSGRNGAQPARAPPLFWSAAMGRGMAGEHLRPNPNATDMREPRAQPARAPERFWSEAGEGEWRASTGDQWQQQHEQKGTPKDTRTLLAVDCTFLDW